MFAPSVGGYFSEPALSYPNTFKGSIFERFPYALPMCFSAFLALISCVWGYFALPETDSFQERRRNFNAAKAKTTVKEQVSNEYHDTTKNVEMHVSIENGYRGAGVSRNGNGASIKVHYANGKNTCDQENNGERAGKDEYANENSETSIVDVSSVRSSPENGDVNHEVSESHLANLKEKSESEAIKEAMQKFVGTSLWEYVTSVPFITIWVRSNCVLRIF